MSKKETIINFLIVKSDGHESVSIALKEATSFIEHQINAKKRWLYVDGVHTIPEEVTPTLLEEASDIRLLNAMIGGLEDLE